MTVLLIILLLLYLCIGAVFSYALYRLYIQADSNYGRGYDDKSGYCVMIGLSWPVSAPFAFAVYFAKYGTPTRQKRGRSK